MNVSGINSLNLTASEIAPKVEELSPAERDRLRACVENIVQKGAVSPEGLLAEIREKIASARDR